MKPAALLALLLAASPASAQTLFSDDAESGTVLVTQSPPGPWPDLQVSGNATVTDVPAAAHRGGSGLRVNDNEGGSGQGSTATVDAPLAAGSSQLFFRTWMRYSALAPGNDIFFMDLEGKATGELKDMLSLSLGAAGSAPNPLYARGWARDQGSLTYLEDAVLADFAPGTWHLLEMALTGIGTASTHRKIWVDGVPLNDRTADTTGFTAAQFVLGEGFGDTSFQGNLDFDDVRLSDAPPGSTLVLSGPTNISAGVCVPLTVTLRDSDGKPAVAPYDVAVTLDSSGELWNASCASAVQSLPLARGQSHVQVGYRSLHAGPDSLRAVQADFRSTPLRLTVAGTGGRIPANPWALNFGCSSAGEGSAPTLIGLGFAALVLAKRCRGT